MTSIRLPVDLERKILQISKQEHQSKSNIIKSAIMAYVQKYYSSSNPYELGKDLFGQYSSKKGNLSANYKTILKKKLHEKHTH